MKCTKQVGENKEEINQQIDKIVKSATSKFDLFFYKGTHIKFGVE